MKSLEVQPTKTPTGTAQKKARLESDRHQALAGFDAKARLLGGARIAGVDEVGMGTLAGPVVSAAVILPETGPFLGVDDSKKVAAARRERLALTIFEHAIATGLGQATVEEIEKLGIFHAGRLAMRRAVMALSVTPSLVFVDARTLDDLAIPQRALIGGDRKSLAVAAASILAKVSRDKQMIALDATHPGYGFAANKGYGTRVHLEALKRLGACPHHRRKFAPVARALAAQSLSSASMRR